MQIPKELSSCTNKALYRLSVGDMTCAEMLAYLVDPRRKNTGFPPEVAERVVALLKDEGFLDDKRYLRIAVRKLDLALAGPRKMRETLTRHRFPPQYVEAALNRRVDYTARAKAILDKRSGAAALAQTPQGRKKLMDHLVRQGYDFSTARSAVDAFSGDDSIFSD